jgi:excisionase family DNA binding protein
MTMKPPEPQAEIIPVLLTGEDIARIMQISRAHAYRLMREADLPVIRIGKMVRVKPADFERFLEKHTRES